jgi:hypothetical protein
MLMQALCRCAAVHGGAGGALWVLITLREAGPGHAKIDFGK